MKLVRGWTTHHVNEGVMDSLYNEQCKIANARLFFALQNWQLHIVQLTKSFVEV
jgi:hypothetical protein